MPDTYREPSLTPEAKAELAERERYARAWRRYSLLQRATPLGTAALFVGGVSMLAVDVAGGSIFCAAALLGGFVVGLLPFRCPRCGALWVRGRNRSQWLAFSRLMPACLKCHLRVGQLSKARNER